MSTPSACRPAAGQQQRIGARPAAEIHDPAAGHVAEQVVRGLERIRSDRGRTGVARNLPSADTQCDIGGQCRFDGTARDFRPLPRLHLRLS